MADAPLTWAELRPLMIAVMEADNTGGHLRGTTNWAAAIAKAVVAAQPQPQPAQPLTGAAPLSDEQIKTVLNEALGGEAVRVPPGWRAVITAVERAHGITAPGTPTPPPGEKS